MSQQHPQQEPAPAETLGGARRCSHCGSTHLHRSRRSGVVDNLLSLMGGKIRRCQSCGTRLACFGSVTLVLERGDDSTDLWMNVIVVVGGLVAAAVAIWWILR